MCALFSETDEIFGGKPHYKSVQSEVNNLDLENSIYSTKV